LNQPLIEYSHQRTLNGIDEVIAFIEARGMLRLA